MSKPRDPVRAQVNLLKTKLSAEVLGDKGLGKDFANYLSSFAKLEQLKDIEHQREVFLTVFEVNKLDDFGKTLLEQTPSNRDEFVKRFQGMLDKIGSTFSDEYKKSCREFIERISPARQETYVPIPTSYNIEPYYVDHSRVDEELLGSYLKQNSDPQVLTYNEIFSQKPDFVLQVRNCFSTQKSEEVPDKLKVILRELFKEDPQVDIDNFTNRVFQGREDFDKLFAESEVLNATILEVKKESIVSEAKPPSTQPSLVFNLTDDYMYKLRDEGNLNSFCKNSKRIIMKDEKFISEHFPNLEESSVSRELGFMIDTLTKEILKEDSEDYIEKRPELRSLIEQKLKDPQDADVKSAVKKIRSQRVESGDVDIKKLKITEDSHSLS